MIITIQVLVYHNNSAQVAHCSYIFLRFSLVGNFRPVGNLGNIEEDQAGNVNIIFSGSGISLEGSTNNIVGLAIVVSKYRTVVGWRIITEKYILTTLNPTD